MLKFLAYLKFSTTTNLLLVDWSHIGQQGIQLLHLLPLNIVLQLFQVHHVNLLHAELSLGRRGDGEVYSFLGLFPKRWALRLLHHSDQVEGKGGLGDAHYHVLDLHLVLLHLIHLQLHTTNKQGQ